MTINHKKYCRLLAWLPVPLFLAAIVMLWTVDARAPYPAPFLWLTLNLLFSALSALFISVMIGRGYISRGTPTLLLIACGSAFLGSSGIVGSILYRYGPNAMITGHNILIWLAGLFHLTGAILSLGSQRYQRKTGLTLYIAYAGVAGLVLLVALLSAHDKLPLFFVPEQGGTALRDYVLGTAIGMFISTAAILLYTHSPVPSAFVRWYSLALLMVAPGLLGLILQPSHFSLLAWIGRAAQYLGGVYMLVAGYAAAHETGTWNISLSAALRESEDRYRSLVELSPDAIIVYQDAHFAFANPAALRLFGASDISDIIGHPVYERIHPAERATAVADMESQSTDKLTPLHEMRIQRMDGQAVHVEAIGASIEFEGRPAKQTVLRDITKRKAIDAERERLLDEAQAERDRLSALVSNIRDEVWFADLEQNFTLANPTALQTFALPPDQRMNVNIIKLAASLEVFRPDGSPRPPLEAPPLRALKGESVISEEEIIRIPSTGKLRYREVSSTPVRDAAGKIIGSVTVVRDITDQKTTQKTLQKHAADLETANAALNDSQRAVLNLMQDAMDARREADLAGAALQAAERRIQQALRASQSFTFDWEPSTDRLQCSASCESILGLRIDKVNHTGQSYFQSMHPDDRPQYLRILGNLTPAANSYTTEYRVTHGDGDTLVLEETGQASFDDAGQMLEIVGVATDITARKRAAEQIKASLAEKEVLLQEVHHRVKNNLQVVSSLVSLQMEDLSDPVVHDLLGDVRDRVRSMALVHEKLYQSADLGAIDFADYANNLLNYLWRAHESITTAVQLNLALESVTLPVKSAVPCGLILNELTGNAIKHAFRDRAEGEVRVELTVNDDGLVCLRVRDNGVGLPPDTNWRESKSLGLRLVQMLAGQLKGTVDAHSAQDQGTEFVFVFSALQ